MKLKSALRSLPHETLERIRAFWRLPDFPALDDGDAGPWIEHLYPRLQNASNFKQAFEALDDPQRDVVRFLAIHGGIMEEKEFARRCFPGRKAEMKEAVEALAARGFVFQERWNDFEGKPRIVGVPEPYLRLIELPHFWQGHLGGLLRDRPIDELAATAAEHLGLKVASHKRDRLLFQIRCALTDPDALRTYIDALPEDMREVLFLILQRRGVVLYRDLLETIQGRRPDLARGNAVGRLLEGTGLLFQVTANPSKYQNLLRVPRDVHYIVANHFVRDQRGIDDLDAVNASGAEQQPKVILDSGISVLRDVVIFAAYMARHSVRRLGNGGIGKNDLKKVLPRLSAGKTLKYVQFLAAFSIGKRILVPTGDQWAVSSSFEDMLGDSRTFYLDLYRAWLDASQWNEEFAEGDTVHVDAPPTNLVDIVEMRRIVLENLSRVPFETWIDGPRFIQSLLAQIELRLPARGKDRLDKHNRINYLVVESILCESLYWLGLVALGCADRNSLRHLGARRNAAALVDEEPVPPSGGGSRIDQHCNFDPKDLLPDLCRFQFQVNGLGRSILGANPDAAGRLNGSKDQIALPFRDDMVQFTVLPNHDIVAPPDLNLTLFWRLQQFTEIRHIDVMSILTLTHDSLRAGMDRGMKGEEILEFLNRGCPSGLPETVRHLVNECRNRYGELSIGYAGGYILVDDPVLLENLRSNKALEPYVKDVLGDRVVLLNRDADVQQVARELQKLGFMPTIDNENVYASTEGRLRFSLKAEDLVDLMGILRFVMHVEEDLDADMTEERARPLFHAVRPGNHAQYDLNRAVEAAARRFEKNYEAALKRKLNAATSRYRRQLKEFLSQQTASRERPAYVGANPAMNTKDVRALLEHAIDHETTVEVRYVRSTNEETVEAVRPESLNGDKLYAFSDERQNYCAYRLRRVKSVSL